jgi:outer membrane protein
MALADTVIGVVDIQKVFNEAKIVSEAKKEFAAKNADVEKEISKRQEKLNEASAKKEVSAAELKKMEDKFVEELKPLKQELTELDAKLTDRVKKNIDTAIKAVAKEQNITITFDKRTVLDGGIDLTDAVIKKLNAGK